MQQNIDAPQLQPDLPNYPPREQLARVTAPSIGGNVYPAVARQWVGGISFRDREPCYVTEPNGTALSPAVYDCILIGNYLGLPLYAVTCCASGSFSSSSSASASIGQDYNSAYFGGYYTEGYM